MSRVLAKITDPRPSTHETINQEVCSASKDLYLKISISADTIVGQLLFKLLISCFREK